MFTGRFDSGILGSFEATRFATGRKNALRVEVSGSEGRDRLRPRRPQHPAVLRPHGTRAPLQGFTKILVTEPEHPYISAWWPAGHMLGYEHGFVHQAKDFVEAVAAGTQPTPSFADGLQVQRVLGAVEAQRRQRKRLDPIPFLTPHPPYRRQHSPRRNPCHVPITLFTGQWADLPLEEVAKLASGWGYDGLELACWGDHLDPWRWDEPGYVEGKLELLEKYDLKVWAISNHLKGQAVCDDPIDQRHRDILSAKVWGDGEPEGVRQRAAEEMKHTARLAAKLGVDDRHRLHRIVDLEVRGHVPARLAGR